MAYTIGMEFEWDNAKNDACFEQRGFDFAYAAPPFSIRTGSSPRIGDGTMARIGTGCSA